MSTSVVDYIFRELAVSYLGRNDLGHATPADTLPDSLGSGVREGSLSGDPLAAIQRVASTGYVRSSNLLVFTGGAAGYRGSAGAATASIQAGDRKSVV